MKMLASILPVLRREWRSGEIRILAYALMVAVASVTAVSFFIDRVERGIGMQSAELLAADLVVESSQPLRDELFAKAEELELRTARVIDFSSVVLRDDDTQLVQVKAVESGYPLRGSLKLRDDINADAYAATGAPGRHEVWIEPRLQQLLALPMPEKLMLGEQEFSVTALIDYEPDRSAELFRLAPRVMMNLDDLTSTGLVTNNSRVSYRLLLAGESDAVRSYRSWLEAHKIHQEEILDVEQSRPELRVALSRAQQYLTLAALVAVLVCGAAIALACRQFAERHAGDSAVLRCLGASQKWIMQRYLLQLLSLAVISSLAGVLIGFLMQLLLVQLLSGWVDLNLPLPGFGPIAAGLVTGIVIMSGFAIPPVLRLGQVSPLRVLRQDFGTASASVWLTITVAMLTLAGVIIVQAADYVLASKFLLASAISCIVFWLLAWLMIRGISQVFSGIGGMIRRYGLSRLTRYPARSALQIAALCVGIAALLVLMVARVDLLESWQSGLPPNAPNHFLVNVQQDEVAGLNALFSQRGITLPVLYPVIKGRLTAINNKPVSENDYDNPRAKRLIDRNFNLTRTNMLPDDNRIIEGDWQGNIDSQAKAFSVESGIAETLDIQIDDRLTFSLDGQNVGANVTSLREVDWDSFNVNFFVIATPALLNGFSASFITSFHFDSGMEMQSRVSEETPLISEIVRRFPSITVLNVDAILSQVRNVMQRAAQAIEFVFLFTLIAGILVMYAAMQAGMRERLKEVSILRVLGASSGQVLSALLTELLIMGVFAGLIAALASSLLTWLLATFVFELPYTMNPWLWILAILGSCLGICVFGLLGLRKVLVQSPVSVLQSR